MRLPTRSLDMPGVLGLLLVVFLSTVVRPAPGPLDASEKAAAGRAGAFDWPQWRGPRRDGSSEETGLLPSWPEKGPPLLWSASGIGQGYSAPIVVGETIYITGDIGEDLVIQALDLEGKPRWRVKNGAFWKNPWPGARSACTHDAGRLYHMNAHGRLACLEAETGKEVWAVSVLERFGARNVTWGQSESVLIDGKKVIATPAGEKALMVALDKSTGETLWASPPLAEEKSSYTSSIIVEVGGQRMLVNTGSLHSFGVDAETGKLLWTHRHPVKENVLGATPVFLKDSVFITNSSREESVMYRLRLGSTGSEVSRVWSSAVKNGQGGTVWVGGRLFGGNGMEGEDGVVAVDPESGAVTKVERSLTFGASVYASGRIYYLSQKGDAALLEPTAEGARIAGRFRLVEPKKNDAWAHPVVCRGRLFLRYHDTLHCYDVRRSLVSTHGAGEDRAAR